LVDLSSDHFISTTLLTRDWILKPARHGHLAGEGKHEQMTPCRSGQDKRFSLGTGIVERDKHTTWASGTIGAKNATLKGMHAKLVRQWNRRGFDRSIARHFLRQKSREVLFPGGNYLPQFVEKVGLIDRSIRVSICKYDVLLITMKHEFALHKRDWILFCERRIENFGQILDFDPGSKNKFCKEWISDFEPSGKGSDPEAGGDANCDIVKRKEELHFP
jgi:hypothetical protein